MLRYPRLVMRFLRSRCSVNRPVAAKNTRSLQQSQTYGPSKFSGPPFVGHSPISGDGEWVVLTAGSGVQIPGGEPRVNDGRADMARPALWERDRLRRGRGHGQLRRLNETIRIRATANNAETSMEVLGVRPGCTVDSTRRRTAALPCEVRNIPSRDRTFGSDGSQGWIAATRPGAPHGMGCAAS